MATPFRRRIQKRRCPLVMRFLGGKDSRQVAEHPTSAPLHNVSLNQTP